MREKPECANHYSTEVPHRGRKRERIEEKVFKLVIICLIQLVEINLFLKRRKEEDFHNQADKFEKKVLKEENNIEENRTCLPSSFHLFVFLFSSNLATNILTH